MFCRRKIVKLGVPTIQSRHFKVATIQSRKFKVTLGLVLGLGFELGLRFKFEFEFPKFPTLNYRDFEVPTMNCRKIVKLKTQHVV